MRADDAIKRSLDFALSGAGLIVLSPLLLGTAAAIALSMGRPVLFRQRRPGRNGSTFTIYKFRTMKEPRPGEERWTSDGARVTKLGTFLRKSSIDELPELWNVLVGEMSLVGPRPLLLEYMPKYTPEQNRRHEVRPGITGWAQVNGRQMIPFSKRLELDVWYVDHRSLALDLKILLETLKQATVGQGQDTYQKLADVDDLGFFSDEFKA